MSKELPYFKFHSSEWLLNRISDENYRVKGIFIDLCAYYWHKECTVSYKEVCKKLGKTNVKLMQDLNFLLIKNDEIVIKFLDEQRAELSDLQAKRSKAGKKGRQAQLEQTPSKSQAPLGHLDKDKIREDKIRVEESISGLATQDEVSSNRDLVFETLAEVCGYDWKGVMTRDERGRLNKAVKQLKDIEATPEDIQLRAKNFVMAYGFHPQPQSITSMWTKLQTNQPKLTKNQLEQLQKNALQEGKWVELEKKYGQ